MRQFSTEGEPNGAAEPGCTVHSMQVVGPATTTEGQHLEKMRSHDCIKTKEQLTIRNCALLLDYVPPEEPTGTPLGNTLRIRQPKLDWRGP